MTEKLQPTALSIDTAAKLLTAVGGRTITPEMIARDTDNGAPLNPDGTINLISYAAWLVSHPHLDGSQEEAARGN